VRNSIGTANPSRSVSVSPQSA